METAMRAGGTILIITVLLGLLAAVGWYAYAGLTGPGEPMPSNYYVALVMGGLAAVLTGMGLMALVFYSSRRGYDEPPHFHEDH
jgi:heme/copper-type cytochrome/quinol oxidase subunit 1